MNDAEDVGKVNVEDWVGVEVGEASQAVCRLGATYAILYSITGLQNLL